LPSGPGQDGDPPLAHQLPRQPSELQRGQRRPHPSRGKTASVDQRFDVLGLVGSQQSQNPTVVTVLGRALGAVRIDRSSADQAAPLFW
jgi:hypothetical protein